MKIKITIESKNCRLKITDAPYFVKIPGRLKISVRSENPRLKISVHQWASRPKWCKCSGHLKGLQADRTQSRRATKGEPERMQEHTTTEGDQESQNKNIFCFIYRYRKIIAKKS